MNLAAAAFAWAVVFLPVVCAVVACIVACRLADMVKQRRAENRILAAEAQSASDLNTCLRIADLTPRNPRRTP